MIVRDICAAVEQLAPRDLAYSWDNAGLAIGSPGASVSCVLVALTFTPDVLRRAKRSRAEMIITHHPPLWEPLRVLRTDDPHTRLCVEAAAVGIACYAAHTNLDVTPGGLNDALAKRLGLLDTGPLFDVPHATQVKLVTFVPESHLAQVRDAVCQEGAGIIGQYTHCSFSVPGTGTFVPGEEAQPFSGRKHRLNEEPEHRFEVIVPKARIDRVVEAMRRAHPYEEPAYDVVVLDSRDRTASLGVRGRLAGPARLDAFAADVRSALETSHVRVVGGSRRKVQSVAVIGGSGGGEIGHVPEDVDVLVTGDVKYHEALDAQSRNLGVVDAGHAAMEKWAVPLLADHVRRHCKGIRVLTYVEPGIFRPITK